MRAAVLDDRGVLAVTGADAKSFLHNVVTCAVEGAEPGAARYGALLTPQGKILADFLLLATADGALIDVARDVLPELKKRLALYRLRAKVAIDDLSDTLAVAVLWDGGDAPPASAASFADPRLPALGVRAFLPKDGADAALAAMGAAIVPAAAWHAHRIALGIPEGGRDFVFGDAFPHEADLDQLAGVDFRKGCYIGQEVVSRMEHRGTARSRVVPVTLDGPAPPPGTEVAAGGRPLGRMGSSAEDRGLALLRLDRAAEAEAAGQPITAGAASLAVALPAWARFTLPAPEKTAS
ncbi:MAG TPA: folate-binding protein [Hyphomicrobiales bacterium]|nr:folate-binding protein [Hyphomicrobiales bacterium]